MKSERSVDDVGAADVPLPGNAWTRFWFTPIPATGLRVLRVLSGLLFCVWLLSFLGHQEAFFSLNGWLDAQGYSDVQRQPGSGAPVGWSLLYLAGDNAAAFQAIYWLSVVVLVLFTLGVATRFTAVYTWFIVVSFLANPAISYDGDYLLAILAFYLMIGHLFAGIWNGALSRVELVLGSRHDFVLAGWLLPGNAAERPLSYAANFMMRLVQIHFVIIMVTSVLHRTQIAEWWSGVAFWFPLHPPFETTAESLEREISRPFITLFLLSLIQYVAVGWQLCLPAFAWREGRAWRGLLLGGAILYWLGVFFVFKLPLFGPFVLLCCLSFLRPQEWAWIVERTRSMFASAANDSPVPEPKKTVALVGKENIKK